MEEPPLKRQKLENGIEVVDEGVGATRANSAGPKYIRENDVGITEFINRNYEGFDCILKYRYSDFVVNEVGLDGQIVVLKETKYINPTANKPKENADKEQANAESIDLSPLSEYFTSSQLTDLHNLYTSKGTSPTEITSRADLTKDQRTFIHKTIRQLFTNHLDSQVTPTNAIRITYANSTSRRTDSKWSQGEYCHFTCKKNNRDTMATASLLAKWLKCHARVIGYAGTKDRRAITTQRMSAHKMKAERLAALNKIANPMGIWVGDFSYSKVPVKLGDLKGNEFIITLREVPPSTDLGEIEKAMASLRENGFINYYGMQRFGTSLVSTHSVGALLLNGHWKEACEAILDVKAGGMNDSLEARELYAKGDIAGALEKMPRTCLAERSILSVLKQDSKHYAGALQAIPRNLRLMYVHAYQSYVWNVVASARIKLNATQVLEGDLILTNSAALSKTLDPDDPDGGIDLPPAEEEDEEPSGTVRALTAEDIASGKYTIRNIVLPTPGYNITYPEHRLLRQAYVDVMARDTLDPYDMRRNVREVSLSGHYRKVVHRPEDVHSDVTRYNGRDTLLDTEELSTEGEFMALRVRLKLGTSQYATMALREICKRDSVDIQYWGKERDELEKARKSEAQE